MRDQVLINNSDLTLKQRIDLIKDFLLRSNIQLNNVEEVEYGFIKFNINLNGKNMSLHILPKNIVNSGWSDKPYIKRIQVMSFLGKNIPMNTRESVSMFLGIAFANEQPIFAVWNPFSYVYHKTNRSCYVNINSISLCFEEGFIKSIDSKQVVLLTDKSHFGDLINYYCEENR